MVDYGKGLRTARQVRDLEQKQVCARAKMSESHLSMLENGKRMPSVEMLADLAAALDVPVWAIVVLGSEGVPDRVLTAARAALWK